MITNELILNILVILVVAWVLGWIFSRFGLPAMLGELLTGIILGPPLLGVIGASSALQLIADLGIFFVMFYTGMEMDPKELMKNVWKSLAVAFGGFILPFVCGYFATRLFGGTVYQSLFMGLGMAITAIAVQSVVLHSTAMSKSDLGHIIIGAAVADDIFSLIGLSVLLSLVKIGTVEVWGLVFILVKVIGLFALTVFLGTMVFPRITKRLHDQEGKAFTFAMVSGLAMAYLAEIAGLHLIIGAFLAGQLVREEIMDKKMYAVIRDRFFGISYGFLVPIFFASLSFHLQFAFDATFLWFTFVIILLAILSKVIGCGAGLALFGHNFWESAIVGFGMEGRGAVELIIASLALRLSQDLESAGVIQEPLLTQVQFSTLILMAFFTTLLAPILLRWGVLKTCEREEKAAFCRLWRPDERSKGKGP